MINQFGDLTEKLASHRGELTDKLRSPEELNKLFQHLPLCPYRLVGAVGNAITRDRHLYNDQIPGSGPKNNDLDFVLPCAVFPAEDWSTLISHPDASEEFELWDDGNMIVPTKNGTFCILNPAIYGDLSTEKRQSRVARAFSQRIDPLHASLHTVSTGELIVFVGQDIARYGNPKDGEYKGVYADVYPLVLGEEENDVVAMFARGYLPQNGYVPILPDGSTFVLQLDQSTRKMPELDLSYISKSPAHAVQFLRRLTKSVIDLCNRRQVNDELPYQLDYYQNICDLVYTNYVLAHIDSEDIVSSRKSLKRKIKKMKNIINKVNEDRQSPYRFKKLSPLVLDPIPV